VFEGRIIKLRVDEVELPDGSHASREIIEHPGAAATVPIDDEGNIYLVRQYRDAIGRELLEIPAGKMKPGEDPSLCARRELMEELGFETDILEHLATFYSTPGFCDEIMHIYLARGLKQCGENNDSEEFITAEQRRLEPLDEILAELDDAKSVAGILLAYQREKRFSAKKDARIE
jgi:ADP-ribose pyrophosphatase